MTDSETQSAPSTPEVPRPETFQVGKRLKSFRSLFSFLAALLLVGFALYQADIDFDATWEHIKKLQFGFYLLAFLLFYAILPVRAFRWRLVLRSAEFPVDDPEERKRWSSLRHLTEILWLSWFVNGVLPARIGDFYRGYLLKRHSKHTFSQSLGTVFAERFADLLVLFVLLLFSGVFAFGLQLNPEVRLIFLGGFLLAVLLVLVLGVFRFLPKLWQKLIPQRFHGQYKRFTEGLLAAFRLKTFPQVLLVTALIWLGEGVRLFLVLQAVGGDISLSAVLFIALLGSLLTSLPLLPGGLGLTEIGLTGALMWFGLAKEEAFTIATLDRLINYWSIVLLGFFLYLFSKKK